VNLQVRLWTCLAGLLASASIARADPPLTALRLHELCLEWRLDPASTAGASCIAYVRGYLDGAAAIDERTASAPSLAESFIERARRTRLGRAQVGRPPYCLAEQVSTSEVIDSLLVYCQTQSLNGEMLAGALLTRVLGEFYPC